MSAAPNEPAPPTMLQSLLGLHSAVSSQVRKDKISATNPEILVEILVSPPIRPPANPAIPVRAPNAP